MEKIKEIINYLQKHGKKPIVEWDNIVVGKKYHIPPLSSIQRSELTILSKTATTLSAKRTLPSTTYDMEINKDSLLAHVLTEIKTF